MAITITEQILRQSLDFSYSEIQSEHPNWSKKSVDDYFNKQTNIYSLARNSQSSDEQIIENTENIATNTENISINSGAIVANAGDISNNTDDISTNADNLTNHINNASGAHASSAISYDNTTSGLAAVEIQAAIDEVDGLVGTNATNIANVTNAFNTHNGSSSQHGVTGDNIGTEDYAQTLVGGSVLLAALVSDAAPSAVSVASPDAPVAAAIYSQADTQANVDLTNELKTDVNQAVADLNNVVAQLNEFLANNKTAKQMGL